MMNDRRHSFRFRMLKSGKMLLGAVHVPCTIRNLSETGACLEVQTTHGIPPKFEFRMSDQSVCTCNIIWTSDTRLGVRFQ
jgi:hypothetical protein